MAGSEQGADAGPRLRSSVRLPWLCTVLTLLLLSGAAFAALDRTVSTSAVPEAVLGSQEHLTSEYAQVLAEQLTRDGQYANEVAGQLDASPDLNQASYFSGLSGRAHPWTTLELVDTARHRALASAGTLDAAHAALLAKLGLPTQTVRTIVTAGGVSQLRIEVPVESSTQLLVLTAPLALTTSGGGQAVLVDANDEVLATSGSALAAAAGGRAHALRMAADGHTGALTAGTSSAGPVVLSFAPVSVTAALSDTGARDVPASAGVDAVADLHLDLMVERAVQAARSTGIARSGQLRVALAAALGMLALALFAATVLWLGLVGPVRRLAAQSAEVPRHGVRDLPGWGGPARALGRNLHLLAVQFGDQATPARRAARRSGPRATAGLLILLFGLGPVLGWAAAVTVAVYRAAPVVLPAQLATDQAASTTVLAQQLRARLAAASADLGTVAVAAQTVVAGDASGGGTGPSPAASSAPAGSAGAQLVSANRLSTLLASVMKASNQYSSIYVLDAHGAIVARTGSGPRVGAAAAGRGGGTAATLVEGATSGRSALLYARIPIGGGDSAIAEFSDAALLSTVQHSSLGTVDVSDGGGRVLLSNASFTAFAGLSGAEAAVARTARAGGAQGTASQVGGGAVVEAGAVSPGGAVFAVTTDRAADKIDVSGVVLRRSVQLLALLAITAALLCGGWLYIMVLMPLRRVAARSATVAAGEHGEAVVPQRADEIGQLARALDLLRRAAQRGRGAPPPPQRATASAWSETSLLPRIPAAGTETGDRRPGPPRRRSDRGK